MQKIEYPYNPLFNALFSISNVNKVDPSIPLPKWQKIPDYQAKKLQIQRLHPEFHSKNSAHWGFLRSKSPGNDRESHYLE